MRVNLKELSNVLSQISDLVAGDKTVPGILFDIRDNSIKICYTDGNKVLSEVIEAEVTENDVKDKIIFNYQALTKIIEACKPTGKIITDTADFTFCDNQVIKVTTEKKIPVISIDPDTNEETTTEKLVSVTEQSINWLKADSGIRVAVLARENYDLNGHFSQSEIDKMYADDPENKKTRPLTTEMWDMESDKWDINELKSILSKLSVESGKVLYIAPATRKAFVVNTSCVICVPIESDIKHKIIQSTSVAKALSTVLSKINTPDGSIHTHILDDDKVVYSTEDNSVAIRLKNLKQETSHVTQVNNCLLKDFSRYMLTFNREVFQSCLYSAKTATSSDKIQISFEPFTELEMDDNGNEVEVSRVKLIMSAKNTNSSTDNKYDVIADYVLDADEAIANLKITVTLEIIYQAVSKSETDYIAFDINLAENNSKMVRIAEIDMDKRAKINEEYKITSGWSPEFMMEHRNDMLGYTTFFAVSAD